MIRNASDLISRFEGALVQAGLAQPHRRIDPEAQTAPHRPHALPKGKCAVYVFSLSQSWGSTCPAGPDRVLKVGKAGPNSNARFQSQHYNPKSARSTVAGSLLRSKVLWPYLGLKNLREDQAGDWLRRNTDRDNFYLGAEDSALLGYLETYLRGLLGPAFEGTESRGKAWSREDQR